MRHTPIYFEAMAIFFSGFCVSATLGSLIVRTPFSKLASGIGMGLVVLGGLAFNLVPMCEPGRPSRDLWRAALIVVVVFIIVFLIAVGSAHLYGLYVQASRG